MPRKPNEYPLIFHDALKAGLGTKEIGLWDDKHDALAQARQFRDFMKSVESSPGHVLNFCLNKYDIFTKIQQLSTGKWSVCVIVKNKLEWREG